MVSDGRKLFYRSGDDLISVEGRTRATLSKDRPRSSTGRTTVRRTCSGLTWMAKDSGGLGPRTAIGEFTRCGASSAILT
jgi:hypothetical protein